MRDYTQINGAGEDLEAPFGGYKGPATARIGRICFRGVSRNKGHNPSSQRLDMGRRRGCCCPRRLGDPVKQRVLAWLLDVDDARLRTFGLSHKDIAILRAFARR
jgi:hypothetical protein